MQPAQAHRKEPKGLQRAQAKQPSGDLCHEMLRASFTGYLKTNRPGRTKVHAMLLTCTAQNEVFCARDDMDNRTVVFVDDGSEVTLI